MNGEFYISGWYVDPPACAISRAGETVKLEPRVMDLLVYLANHPGQVHSRDELLDQVWSGIVVSDEALTNAIIKLRKAFGDDARHPRIIETLSKRGYRLVASVERTGAAPPGEPAPLAAPQGGDSGKRRPWFAISFAAMLAVAVGLAYIPKEDTQFRSFPSGTAGLTVPEIPSIAVLPFADTDNESGYSYFSEGITDDLITDLSRLSGLFVISRNSTFVLKGRTIDIKSVASQLGVRYVLDGSVRRNGDRVRVNTSLSDGFTGEQLWAERYDGELQDVFGLQDRITARIVSALPLELTGEDRSQLARQEIPNAAAYDEFLKGWEYRWRINRDNYAQAEKHFLKALELEPGYARAHSALAQIYWQSWLQRWHANSGETMAGWQRARRELEAAMKNPSALDYSLRSAMRLHNRFYDEAIAEARKAIALSPGSATGYLALAEAQSYAGESAAAIENAIKALRYDPNFAAPYRFVEGRALFDSKRYREAVDVLERSRGANPADYNPLIFIVAALGHLNFQAKATEVRDQLNQLLQQDNLPEFTMASLRNRWPYRDAGARSHFLEGLRAAGVPEW